MATQRQIEANRCNALLSTGPRTPEGKARSRLNARKHGLFSSHRLAPRDQRAFIQLRDALRLELQPAGPAEDAVITRLATVCCHFGCINRLEAVLFSPSLRAGQRPTATFETLVRYQARAQRAFYKALADLRTLQNRRNEAIPPRPEPGPREPPPASQNSLFPQSTSGKMET